MLMDLFINIFVMHAICSTSIELTAANLGVETGKRVAARLSWTSADNQDFYIVLKRQIGGDWQSMSTFDYNDDPIRVLNAYPTTDVCDWNYESDWKVLDAHFVFASGESRIISKSASLKVWMEGGSVDGMRSDKYGRDPVTGLQRTK